ncbi:hypothetical protein [Bradyrhizobium sp. UFLA05-112]
MPQFIHELPCWRISMHANFDDLAIAVTPRPSAFPADLDVSNDLDVGHSFSRLAEPIVLGFVMPLFSAALAFELCGGLGACERAAGRAGVLLFGLVICRLIWMSLAERCATVSHHRIRDLRAGDEFLLWDSIEDVSVRESYGCKTVMLTPALRRQLRSVRSRGAISPRNDTDFSVIAPAGPATDFATLLRACLACHDASKLRAALQQKSHHDVQGFAVKAS